MGASIQQDVSSHIQEEMVETGTFQDDLSAWLSRYHLTPVAPVGEATLSPHREMHSLDIIDLEEGSSPSSRELQRAASPPTDVVTSPYRDEGVTVGVQQGLGEFEQFIADMTLGA